MGKHWNRGGARTGARIAKLTVGDKILVLLLDYTRFRGELQAPMDVTQDGIAERLGIIRSAVPRAVGGLIEKGFVEEYLAHIDGMSRRRKVYMLTESGIVSARELLDEIGMVEVEVMDNDGSTRESASALIAGKKLDLSNLSRVIMTRKLDLRTTAPKEDEQGQSPYMHSLSPPDIFLDREREMEEIKLAIRSPKRKVTVVYGIAGVGKTTLAWRISQIYGGEMHVFYMDMKEWTTLPYLLRELGTFLSLAGWGHLKEFLESNREDIEACTDLLKALPKEVPLLMIIDDLHRASREVLMFLSSLRERLAFMKNVNLIVLSRTKADFYDVRDVKISGLVGELELLGFDRETSRQFLVERGFPREEVDEIIESTGGHPLALVLVEKEGMDVDISDFDEFLRTEIFSRLDKVENYTLALISLSRLQLRDDELIGFRGCTPEVLKRLCDQRLVFYSPSGYIVHDLVRDQARSNLNREDRERAHRDIAAIFHEKLTGLGFYQDIGTDLPPAPFTLEDVKGIGPATLYVTEEANHLLKANMVDEAIKVVIRSVLQIPSKDLLDEIVPTLEDRLPPVDRQNVSCDFYRAIMHIHRGEFERALRSLERVSRNEGEDDLDRAMALCSLFWLPWTIERIKGPEEALEKLDSIDGLISDKLRYYFLTYRASLMYKLGNHKGSSDAYGRFLDEVMSNEEFPLQLKEVIKGSLEVARTGGIQKATDNFQRIMELTRTNRDLIREEMPFVDVDHHLLSAIYSVFYGRNIKKT